MENYQLEIKEVFEQYKTTPQGLSPGEIEERRKAGMELQV